MKHLLSFLLAAIGFCYSYAQTEYVNPPLIKEKTYTVEIKDIVASKGEFKFAFIIENKTSDKYLMFELSKIAIAFSNDEVYYPNNDEIIVVDPNDKVRRTVRIVGNADYQKDKVQIEFPKVEMNDQQVDFKPVAAGNTSAEQTIDLNGTGNITLSGLSFKKESWSGEMNIKTGTFDGMLVIDITKILGKTADGTLPIEFKRDKLGQIALIANDKFKSKFSIADLGQKLQGIDFSTAFKLYSLRQLDLPQITVKKVGYVEPTAPENKEVTLCESFEQINNLPVKIVVFNPNGVCFKLASNGKKINPEFSSNVTFDTEYGTTILTLNLNNGQTLTDKIYPAEGDVYLSFELILRKGEYKLQRKFDLSGDARKAKVIDKTTVICKDYITLNNEEMNFRANLTVTKITKDRVYYIDCNSNSEKSVSKMEILDIQYANGYHDKFDYPGNQGKQNMDLTRTEEEVIELRNSSKTSSSIIIGPNRH